MPCRGLRALSLMVRLAQQVRAFSLRKSVSCSIYTLYMMVRLVQRFRGHYSPETVRVLG